MAIKDSEIRNAFFKLRFGLPTEIAADPSPLSVQIAAHLLRYEMDKSHGIKDPLVDVLSYDEGVGGVHRVVFSLSRAGHNPLATEAAELCRERSLENFFSVLEQRCMDHELPGKIDVKESDEAGPCEAKLTVDHIEDMAALLESLMPAAAGPNQPFTRDEFENACAADRHYHAGIGIPLPMWPQ